MQNLASKSRLAPYRRNASRLTKIGHLMEKYENKYRIATARAIWWNYGWNGAYFVTICTKNKVHYFGHIQNGLMCLNEMGQIAHQCWLDIPAHFPFVQLGAFVIMPNHVHGIIVIDKTDDDHDTQPKNRFGPQSKNLGSIIRGFKIGVTKNARLIQPEFTWQPRYHDHIIRNQPSYDRIANYINNNPTNWGNK